MQPKVLIFSQDAKKKDLLSTVLESLHFTLVKAQGHSEAIYLFEHQQFNLCIIEAQHDPAIGLDIIERLRSGGQNTNTYVLSLWAVDDAHSMIEAYQRGADDAIGFPDTPLLQAKLNTVRNRITATMRETRKSQRIKTRINNLEQDIGRAAKNLSKFTKAPKVPGLEIGICEKAYHKIGGDFIDIFPRPNGTWAIVFGDIMGHGIQAAMFKPTVHLILKEHFSSLNDLSDVLIDINNDLAAKIPTNHFAAMCVLEWFPNQKYMRIYRHGVPYPLLYQNNKTEQIISEGSMLGIISAPSNSVKLSPYQTSLASGDSIVLMTDGLAEAHDKNGVQLQKSQNMHEISKPEGAPSDAAKLIFTRTKAQGFIIEDDALVVILRVK